MHARPSQPADPPPEGSLHQDDYNRLFALSLDLLCVAGLDGYFKKVNPSWTRVLGWSEDELLSRPIADFMHPDDRERTLQARANLANGIPVRGLENRYLCKDGSHRWLSWQTSIQPGDTTVFGIARDITERRKIEHEQLILSKLESTGILAGGLAHDFNNLLGGMLLNLDMVGLCGALTDEQQEYLRQVHHAIHAAKSLTQQLIAFSHGGVSARRTLELKPLLQHSLDLALRGSTVVGECHVAADLWPVEVDESQIGQVIHHLVLNAREASPPGAAVRIHASNIGADETTVPGSTAAGWVRISVSDRGSGIAAEVMPKIFDPYFSTKQRGAQKGMGLGLTICRTIVHQHGGRIFAEAQRGEGTIVTCELPAVRGAVAEPRVTSTVAGARRILVMDDEPMFRDVVVQALRHLGYQVESAEHGDQAISLYEQARQRGCRFDLVLLDLTVRGGKGGSETMKFLRAQDSEVNAVLMSGYTSEQTFRDYAAHGFRGALSKPFSIEALHATLGKLLQPATGGTAPGN